MSVTSPAAVAVSSRSCNSGVGRLLRGWLMSAAAVLLAAAGHQIAHSVAHGPEHTQPIPWLVLAVTIVLCAPVAVAVAGRRISMWSTALATSISQVVFHLIYTLAAPALSGHGASVQAVGAHAGHHHHIDHLVVVGGVGETAHAADHGGMLMIVAHLIAAALTTWMVAYGEQSVVALAEWLLIAPARRVLEAQPAAADAFHRLRFALLWSVDTRSQRDPYRRPQWTRGPPALSFSTTF